MADFIAEILKTKGAPDATAKIVADHLVEADSMGLHSHGSMRVPQYLDDIEAGVIFPTATPRLIERSKTSVVVEGCCGFGQVVAQYMAETAIRLARNYGTAFVAGRHMGHTGRIGAFAEEIARAGYVGLAFCSGPPNGHWVAPFGGRDGRVATNPIAFALPRTGTAPLAADFSTSVAPEGVIRNLMIRGSPAPEGAMRDAEGRLSTEPKALYGPPRGALQPFGGAVGYRGTALALMVEALATLASGDLADDTSRSGSNFALMAIDAGAGFDALVAGLSDYVASSAPLDPTRPVMVPGDREQAVRAANGDSIEIDRTTWARITALAVPGTTVPEPL